MLPILAAALVLVASFDPQQEERHTTGAHATSSAPHALVRDIAAPVEQFERHVGQGLELFVRRSTIVVGTVDLRATPNSSGRVSNVYPADSQGRHLVSIANRSWTDVWIPVEATTPAYLPGGGDVSVIALTPAFRQGALDAAVWLIGSQIAFEDCGFTNVREWRPGFHVGATVAAVADRLRAAATRPIDVAAFDAARKSLWDGTTLTSTKLDALPFTAVLESFGYTPDAIGAELIGLDHASFMARRAEHFDVARTRFLTIGGKAPEGAVDLSRTAWERSEPAAVERAEKLLAAVGGAEAWSALDSVRLEVETATHTPAYTHTARSTTLRCLTCPLTLIEQSIDDGQSKLNIRTGFIGNDLWLERESDGERVLMELPRAQIERAIHGERRALPRVLRMLATREKVGVKNGADGSLELFDDGGPFCRLELDADSRVRALVDDEGPTQRRLEFERWEEFAGVVLPTRHREIGERTVEVTLLAFEKVDALPYSRFLSPLTR